MESKSLEVFRITAALGGSCYGELFAREGPAEIVGAIPKGSRKLSGARGQKAVPGGCVCLSQRGWISFWA